MTDRQKERTTNNKNTKERENGRARKQQRKIKLITEIITHYRKHYENTGRPSDKRQHVKNETTNESMPTGTHT